MAQSACSAKGVVMVGQSWTRILRASCEVTLFVWIAGQFTSRISVNYPIGVHLRFLVLLLFVHYVLSSSNIILLLCNSRRGCGTRSSLFVDWQLPRYPSFFVSYHHHTRWRCDYFRCTHPWHPYDRFKLSAEDVLSLLGNLTSQTGPLDFETEHATKHRDIEKASVISNDFQNIQFWYEPSSISFAIKTSGSPVQVVVRWTLQQGTTRRCNVQTTWQDFKAYQFATDCEEKSNMEAKKDNKFCWDLFKTLEEIDMRMIVSMVSIHVLWLCLSSGRVVSIQE